MGGDAGAGRDDADEVQGIAGREADDIPLAGSRRMARSESSASGGQLLSHGAVDEVAAADLAAHLEAAVDADELAPGRSLGLAAEEIAEDDAVAAEVEAGEGLVDDVERGLARGARGRRSDQRPAETWGEPPRRRLTRHAGSGRLRSISARRPEKPSPVIRPRATSSQRASSISTRPWPAEATISSKNEAPSRSSRARTARAGREVVVRGRGRRRAAGAQGEEPGEIAAAREGDRRGAGRRRAGVARREAAPDDLAGEAELVEPGGLVAHHPRGEDLALPGAGRDLEALELLDDAERPARPRC